MLWFEYFHVFTKAENYGFKFLIGYYFNGDSTVNIIRFFVYDG